jgi:hypothetical protein
MSGRHRGAVTPRAARASWYVAVLDGTTYALGQVDGDIALKRLLNIQ